MKKVLWIACLLCMLPFLGMAQNRAGLAMQDEAAGFGQAPVSKELPKTIQLKNVTRDAVAEGDTIGDFHTMYIPETNMNFGRYYHITLVGSTAYIEQVRMYNDWYYSAADYYYNAEEQATAPEYPVWAYANDYTKGFMNIHFENGNFVKDDAQSISLSMNDMTYDYNHGYMLGTKFGRIYKLTLATEEGISGAAEIVWDCYDHDTLKPVAIACDLDGTLYFVSLSPDGTENSKLYKFEGEVNNTLEPVEVGDLEWPAYCIQTMAFDHNTRRLFWWACDIDGNTMLKEVDKETAACTDYFPETPEGDGLTTEMGGLIFEFEYRDYTVTCINTEGTLTLDNGQTTNQYKPGANVNVTVVADQCQTLDYLVALNAADHTDTIAIIYNDELVNGVGTFAMPACDVDVDAVWSGNEHTITVTVTPSSMQDQITTNPSGTGECGSTITINYGHPAGYMLSRNTLKAKYGTHNISLNGYNNYSATFTMPDANVNVTGTYVTITVDSIPPMCQWQPLAAVPAFTVGTPTVNTPASYQLTYFFKKPGTTAWVEFDSDAMLNGDSFDKAGTWTYYVQVHNMYGNFQTTEHTFDVLAAPKSIALEGNQYNCDGDSIVLTVVPNPTTATMTGTFTWYKDGDEYMTTTEPKLLIEPCSTTDAGVYSVSFAPGADDNTESTCEVESEGYNVNVSTIPNKPNVGIVGGGDSICYHSYAEVEWLNGVLDPDEYIIQWYYVDAEEDAWYEIENANLRVLNTAETNTVIVSEDSTFTIQPVDDSIVLGLSIRYAGDNNLCHRESDPFTVHAKDSVAIEISGDLETCLGFIPEENPYVDGDYVNFVWTFDGETVLEGEDANVLDFENNAELGALLQEAGTHVLEVAADDPDGCTIFGTYDFVVKELPNVYITNNITGDTAYYNDDPVLTINVCAGDIVELTAHGADTYRWGDAKDGETEGETGEGETEEETVSTITVLPTVTTTYSVSGYSEETGCWNTTTIRVNVIQAPEITWLNPTTDTTFSMITDDFELQATPAGGIFSYAIAGDPDDVDYPILDEEGNPTNHFNPSLLGIGDYLLIYSVQNDNGCSNETHINISVEKPYWTDIDKWDSLWYQNCTEADRWEIADPHQMGSFMAYLYGLNGVEKTDFAGITIYLNDNIDLQEKPYFYRPLCDTAVFAGTFDGSGKIISNMVILEEDLEMNITGNFRNVGFKDAKISNTTSETIINLADTASMHNCFVTKPVFLNVIPNFEPEGEVRNVYYVGPNEEGEETYIYMDNAADTPVVIEPVENEALLHVAAMDEPLEGILEEWVWLANDFSYFTWNLDDEEVNYGWPIFETRFEHHHYIVVADYEEGTHEFDGAQERTIDEETYTYAMNGDEVTITFHPDKYVIFDTVTIIAHDYRELGVDLEIEYEYADNSFTFTMPLDSLYEPAYWVEIIPMPRRDYWTDGPEVLGEGNYNYNPNWYNDCVEAQQFEITSNEDLAALARMVDFEGIDFDGITVFITGPENGFLDMSDHMWRPIYGFRGTLDGTHFIVDSLYIRENYEGSMYPYVNAMFVDLMGVIRNLGVQDIDLPEEGALVRFDTGDDFDDDDEEWEEEEIEPMVAAIAYNDMTVREIVEEPGSVYNSFVTVNPNLHIQYPIAGPGINVVNTYTLDPNGNMIDGNGDPIDFDMLRAWVAEANAAADSPEEAVYYDWILDEELINYSYPIHDPNHEPGFNITYIPSSEDYQADPEGHGFVSGPTIGHEGETIIVTSHPDYCYDLTQLWLIHDEDSTDIKGTVNSLGQYSFEMPAYPVTVYAVYTPYEWTFTINYVDIYGETVADPYTSTQHYADEITVESPEVEGMVPDFPVMDTVMICGNMTVTVTYDGEEHNISFCEGMIEGEDEDGDPIFADWIDEIGYQDVANYTHEVTITIVPLAGLSIGNLTITDMDGNEVDYTNEAGSYDYTFIMPNSDVIICAEPTEEYWDDWSIADISWFVGNEDADTFYLATDSMLGGLAALVTGREWLYDTSNGHDWLFEGEPYEEGSHFFDFAGKTIIVQSEQEEGMIDLIEHKWRPIGAQIEFERWFQGYFDGNGHQIINMTTADIALLDEPGNGSCQAFFGHVGEEAVINDLDIQGLAQGRYFTAGIAGISKGTIINSVARVNVRSEFEAAGIVGNNYGNIYNSYCAAETIECWSAAPDAKGTNNYYVGGIAAWNSGEISNCHSVAELVKGNGYNPINYYGGLVGMNDGILENSYWMVNPIEDAVGAGDAAVNCAVIGANTASLMNTNATELTAATGYDLFGWTVGDDDYPVFDRQDREVMDIDNIDLNISLYPNPASDVVKVECDNMQRVMVYNMFGQLVAENVVNNNKAEIQVSAFASGIYTVRIITAEGSATRTFVVK